MGTHPSVELHEVSGRYLFVVTRDLEPERIAGLTGIHGAGLELVPVRDLQAVVCSVDLSEFGEEAVVRNLEDLQWLEEVARCHHEVVVAVSASSDVAPMRLVTICSDDDSVRQKIHDLYDDLSRALDRVEGRREWSVKAYAKREDPTPVAEPATSGAAYLQRKREQNQARRNASEHSVQDAHVVHDLLSANAVASRILSPQDSRLTGRTETMVLNAAYLVPEPDADAFTAHVLHLADSLGSRLHLELDGPWPPYSFTTLD